METAAFITSLVTSFSVFCFLIIFYEFMSRLPRNYHVYYPLRLLRGLDLPDQTKTRRPLTWLREAWQASESDIIALAGLDGAVYLSLFETSLKIVGYTAIFCLPVLIPLAATSHNYKAIDSSPNSTDTSPGLNKIEMRNQSVGIMGPSFGGFDKLAMGNISDHDSNRMWAFAIGAYWLSVVTYVTLWKKYKHILKLRNSMPFSKRAPPEDFTVLVRDIPYVDTMPHAEQVDIFFRKLYPDTYRRCLIVTKLKETSKFWEELRLIKQKLAQSEANFLSSKTKENPEGSRPQHRTRFFGLFGSKVDSMIYFRKKMEYLSVKLEAEQSRVRIEEQKAAAFVFFNSRTAAACAAQVIHAPFGDIWRTTSAPEPEDVVWENISISYHQRILRHVVVNTVVFLTILFYMIPITFVSALTTWDNLQNALPFMKRIGKVLALSAIFQAYLPQLALIFFLTLLPTLLKYLSKLEGIISKSHLLRATAGKYFYFVIFNVFLGVTLGTTVLNSLKKLKKNFSFDSLIQLLGSSLPPAASFFTTYIALRLFIGYGLELSQMLPLFFYHLKKKFVCMTEAELKRSTNPGHFKYHQNIPNDILVLTIALCYGVIAPMVLIFAILYFGLGWFVVRNQALKVYVPSFDSRGRFWPHIHARILVALFVSQLTMLGYFTIKKFLYTFLLLPLPGATLVFGYLCRDTFYRSFRVTPLVTASMETIERPSLQELLEAYTPTCLLQQSTISDFDMESHGESSSEINGSSSKDLLLR